jgi:hypothetical protein
MRGSLRRPLRVANLARILVLEIPGICFDVQDVTEGLVCLGGTCLVGAGDRLQMRQRRIEFRVRVQLTHRLLLVHRGIERLFQDKGFCRRGRRHRLRVAAVLAIQFELVHLDRRHK